MTSPTKWGGEKKVLNHQSYWTTLRQRTSRIPPSWATTTNRIIDKTPNIKILPLTITYAVRSDGRPLKQPRQMSSSNTPAVEFSTTDNELQTLFQNQETPNTIDMRKIVFVFFTSKLHRKPRQWINRECHDICQLFSSHKRGTIDRPSPPIPMFLDRNPRTSHKREFHRSNKPTQTKWRQPWIWQLIWNQV